MLNSLLTFTFIFALTLAIIYVRNYLRARSPQNAFILANYRYYKIKCYLSVAQRVIDDITEASQEKNGPFNQTYALLPLLADVKKQGAHLISKRKFYHWFLLRGTEKKLVAKVDRVCQTEFFLKSISRHTTLNENTILSVSYGKVGSL